MYGQTVTHVTLHGSCPNEESMIVSLKSLAMPVKHNSLVERNHDLKKTRRQVTEDAVQRLSPFCRLPFLWLVRKATSLFPFKDDRNHYVYAGVMSIREYGLEIGRRLKAHDLLESKADVFLLEWEERFSERSSQNQTHRHHSRRPFPECPRCNRKPKPEKQIHRSPPIEKMSSTTRPPAFPNCES